MSARQARNLSASPDDYLEWICTERLRLDEKDIKLYFKLFGCLLNVGFASGHPNDARRESEGLNLRDDFEYETGLYLEGLMPRCSFMEMLVALAYRCERQLMRSAYYGDRTSQWFFDMIDSLGLRDCTGPKWSSSTASYIQDKCELMMNRKICLFDYKGAKKNINEEIWKQLSAYINEKYVDDSEFSI